MMRAINSLGYLLNHIAFVMARQSDQVLQERLGIGFSQFKIMMVLSHKPHIQQKEIADKLGQT
jgi:DNA-binding MarR family transcriptional regulator